MGRWCSGSAHLPYRATPGPPRSRSAVQPPPHAPATNRRRRYSAWERPKAEAASSSTKEKQSRALETPPRSPAMRPSEQTLFCSGCPIPVSPPMPDSSQCISNYYADSHSGRKNNGKATQREHFIAPDAAGRSHAASHREYPRSPLQMTPGPKQGNPVPWSALTPSPSVARAIRFLPRRSGSALSCPMPHRRPSFERRAVVSPCGERRAQALRSIPGSAPVPSANPR